MENPSMYTKWQRLKITHSEIEVSCFKFINIIGRTILT